MSLMTPATVGTERWPVTPLGHRVSRTVAMAFGFSAPQVRARI